MYWLLEGKELIPCGDFLEFAKWYETADRQVRETYVRGLRVSAIFQGLDLGLGAQRRPLLFETLVFDSDGLRTGIEERYSTWDEAVVGHAVIAAKLRLNRPDRRPSRAARAQSAEASEGA